MHDMLYAQRRCVKVEFIARYGFFVDNFKNICCIWVRKGLRGSYVTCLTHEFVDIRRCERSFVQSWIWTWVLGLDLTWGKPSTHLGAWELFAHSQDMSTSKRIIFRQLIIWRMMLSDHLLMLMWMMRKSTIRNHPAPKFRGFMTC